MSFEAPLLLLTLLVVPLAIVAYLLLQRGQSKYAVSYSNLDVLASVTGGPSSWARHLPAGLLLAALAAFCVTLARPTVTVAAPQEQATVVLVVDVSGSMRAEDVDPTRLEAAQKAMRTFVDKVPKKLRVALVAFSDGPEVVTPPTADRALLRAGIDYLTPGFGTAIGDALARAVEVVAPPSETGGVRQAPPTADGKPLSAILLLSDGAQTRGTLSPGEGASRAQQAKIPIYTIALGTDEGTIEVFRFGEQRTIPVPPDRTTLRQVAEATGGEYYDAPDAERVESVYSRLGSLVGRADEQREVSVAFLAGGAALLVAAGAAAALRLPKLP
jgi:Ca-activated chloride channel family protein